MKKEKVKNFIILLVMTILITLLLVLICYLFKDRKSAGIGLICGLILYFLDSLFLPFYDSKKPVLSKLSFGDLLFTIMSGLCGLPIMYVNSKLTYMIGFILGLISLSFLFYFEEKRLICFDEKD